MAAYHLNNCVIEGNVGRDATTGQTKTGDTFIRFSIANNRGEKDPLWVNVVMYGKNIENLAQYVLKGRKVVVIGAVSLSSYTKEGDTCETVSLSLNARELSLPSRCEGEAPITASGTGGDAEDLDEELNI
jgi:single-stranded DNA-binding protein